MEDENRNPREDSPSEHHPRRRTEDAIPLPPSATARHSRSSNLTSEGVLPLSHRDPPSRTPRLSLPEATIGPIIEETGGRRSSFTSDRMIPHWECTLIEVWLHFPGEANPVFGWFRAEASPYADAFFGTDGGYRPMTRNQVERYRVLRPPSIYLDRMIHPALQQPAHLVLTDHSYVPDPDSNSLNKPVEGNEWREIILPGYPTSLSYGFNCSECQQSRAVRRDHLSRSETLSRDYRFHCKDVGAQCHLSSPTKRYTFLRTQSIPRLNIPVEPKTETTPTVAPLSFTPYHPNETPGSEEAWRKRMKLWAGAVTYNGSPSLV